MIKWFPIIWKDRDFDYCYFLSMMKFKLEQMETFFRSDNTWSMGVGKTADEIKRCILLLDRIIEDDYGSYDVHDKKWGEMKMDFKAARDGLSEMVITRPNVITDKDKKQESKEWKRCMEHEEMLKKQDMKYLFELMEKNLKGWWD